jgi:hypothetical protein
MDRFCSQRIHLSASTALARVDTLLLAVEVPILILVRTFRIQGFSNSLDFRFRGLRASLYLFRSLDQKDNYLRCVWVAASVEKAILPVNLSSIDRSSLSVIERSPELPIKFTCRIVYRAARSTQGFQKGGGDDKLMCQMSRECEVH